MKSKPRWIIFWAAILLLVATPSLAQQRPLSCQEVRDRALTRVTIVSNSRVTMEEDLASLSVTLRYARQRMAKMETELKSLKEKIKLAETKEAETETAEAEGKPKAPSDVQAGEKEKEAEKPKGIEEEQTQ